jgi:uncharacterized membrane protein (UPF0182 family)
MNFVSKTTGGGLPQYLLENIPAESQYGLKYPAGIYFGNVAPGYKIVEHGIKEFDYPKGNENVYASYQGEGRNSDRRHLEEAAVCMDTERHQYSADLLPETAKQDSDLEGRAGARLPSRALSAPGQGPYAVLSEGKQYWIQDAYTVSDRYPYSNVQTDGSAQGMNYIRNSVKVVVDMYNGACRSTSWIPRILFWPCTSAHSRGLQGSERAFPDLKSHLRYPEDLFGIQAANTRPSI